MSLAAIDRIAHELPQRLADDVIGYARSVQAALPDIFLEAGVRRTEELANQLVFIAGVKKLYSISSSNYWILANSFHALREQVTEVRLGSTVISRQSPYFRDLRELHADLLRILADNELFDFMELTSYTEIARRLARER